MKPILTKFHVRMTAKQVKAIKSKFDETRKGERGLCMLAIEPNLNSLEFKVAIISEEFGTKLATIIQKARKQSV